MNNDQETLKTVDTDLVDGRFLHASIFAQRTGRKESTVKEYLRKKKLIGKKDGAEWFVDWIWYGERLRALPDNQG